MQRIMLKSKIHRATVTDANLNYMGSITIDQDLLDAADILHYEQVQVVNLSTGGRFETYAMLGKRGSGTICLNGAAARLVQPGDKVIVFSYVAVEDVDCSGWKPKVVLVGDTNRDYKIASDKEML